MNVRPVLRGLEREGRIAGESNIHFFQKRCLHFVSPGDKIQYRSVVAESGFSALIELFFDTIFDCPVLPLGNGEMPLKCPNQRGLLF